MVEVLIMKIIDISKMQDVLTNEELEIVNKVINVINQDSILTKVCNVIFGGVLLYACFTMLPLWAAVTLIGTRLTIPVISLCKIWKAAGKIIKENNITSSKILEIRYKLAKYNENNA